MKALVLLKFHLLMIVFVFTVSACATQEKEVPTDHLDSGPNIVRIDGQVSNIREVKKDASLGKQFAGAFVGALIGGQLGGGSASTVLGTSGAFIGAEVVNKKYGTVIDRVILKGDDGKEYECLVHDHIFKVGDRVVFTLVAGHVTAIIEAQE